MNRREFLKSTTFVSFGFLFNDTVEASSNISIINDSVSILQHKDSDIILNWKQLQIMKIVANKLHTVKKMVGYGNFNIISLDELVYRARWSKGIKRFTKEELNFIEYIFYRDPTVHGFYGNRTCEHITEKINKKEISKIPYTGHYLFKGESYDKYFRVKHDVGKNIILTSGVRSIVKQMSLYFDKVLLCNGNVSLASRSLAPPAYSFHSLGDFDIGKKGYGYDNFTARFALTKEFREVKKLSYIDMRYTINNLDGVRYEPWHVKIV
jgi:hypothetical protein